MSGKIKPKNRSILYVFVPPLFFFFFLRLETILLKTGGLNTKDLAFIGEEKGTFFDYATNVWVWDVFSLLLGIVSFFCVIMGIRSLITDRKRIDKA